MSNNVFPIRKAYDFAFKGGGKTGDIMRIVKHRNSIPKSLIDLKYGGKTQARRALIYILFKNELPENVINPETQENFPL